MKHATIIEHRDTYELVADEGWWITNWYEGIKYPVFMPRYVIMKMQLDKFYTISDDEMYRHRLDILQQLSEDKDKKKVHLQ